MSTGQYGEACVNPTNHNLLWGGGNASTPFYSTDNLATTHPVDKSGVTPATKSEFLVALI